MYAVNTHDVDALTVCFAEDYVNATPAHPSLGFVGRAQVRTNWSRLFGALPDLRARVLRCTADGTTVWSEWDLDGTRPDGSRAHLAGVIIFGVDGGCARWARFYLEPVEDGADTVDDAVGRVTTGGIRVTRYNTGCVPRTSEVEVGYVQDSSGPVATTVAAVDPHHFVHGVQVRRVRTHRRRRHAAGTFWPATHRGHVLSESRGEPDRVRSADFAAEASRMAAQPMWKCGSTGTGSIIGDSPPAPAPWSATRTGTGR
ncbi:nuclear transport factor 2 family protein [Rhodococcus aetherivorans]|uniref:nuclear transport factor 2 family protein n=1 Tax=Rhodococcus aetherivorans TaxID=191292 RepID=UPI0036A0AF46